MPALFPAQKPTLLSCGRSVTQGYSLLTSSADPSVDPLSTTQVTKSWLDCTRSDSRHGTRSSLPLKFSTITAQRGRIMIRPASLGGEMQDGVLPGTTPMLRD